MYIHTQTYTFQYKIHNCSVPGKRPWALKHSSRFWPAWVLTRDIHVHVTSIRLYRSWYWPLKMSYMGTYPGMGACLGHYSTCTCTSFLSDSPSSSSPSLSLSLDSPPSSWSSCLLASSLSLWRRVLSIEKWTASWSIVGIYVCVHTCIIIVV